MGSVLKHGPKQIEQFLSSKTRPDMLDQLQSWIHQK